MAEQIQKVRRHHKTVEAADQVAVMAPGGPDDTTNEILGGVDIMLEKIASALGELGVQSVE